MERRRAWVWSLMVFSGLMVGLWALGTRPVTSFAGAGPTLGRAEDPVVVAGSALTEMVGMPVEELVAYRYSGEQWEPIPFQIDERTNDITGTYVVFEDGLLDANDEVVVMAGDAGDDAGAMWPDDATAQQHPRYRLAVTDPLSAGAAGWFYLYRSPTLTTSAASYVAWNQELQSVSAVSYTAAFSPSAFLGLADLTLNGDETDILDRQKLRLRAFGGIITFNEESIRTLITPTVSISVTGPVRAVSSGGAFNVAVYGSRLEFLVLFDTTGTPLTLDSMRTSFDLRDPAVTGLSHYFDSNGSAATIDGLPDTVPTTPAIEWYQASGAPGGLFVGLPLVDGDGGTVTTYYLDDGQLNAQDTGDQRSYADTGLFITDPGTVVTLNLVSYILPPDTTTSVGADYAARIAAPLTVAATAQTLSNATESVYLPLIAK